MAPSLSSSASRLTEEEVGSDHRACLPGTQLLRNPSYSCPSPHLLFQEVPEDLRRGLFPGLDTKINPTSADPTCAQIRQSAAPPGLGVPKGAKVDRSKQCWRPGARSSPTARGLQETMSSLGGSSGSVNPVGCALLCSRRCLLLW